MERAARLIIITILIPIILLGILIVALVVAAFKYGSESHDIYYSNDTTTDNHIEYSISN